MMSSTVALRRVYWFRRLSLPAPRARASLAMLGVWQAESKAGAFTQVIVSWN